jgi:hypothetical protein
MPDTTAQLGLFADRSTLKRCIDCNNDLPIERFRIRKNGRGNAVPKGYCGPCETKRVAEWRAKNTGRYEHTCAACGELFRTSRPASKTCSSKCNSEHGAKGRSLAASTRSGHPAAKYNQWSPLRKAFDSGDLKAILNELMPLVTVERSTGCWKWLGLTKSGGYAVVSWSGKNIALHRAVLEAKYGSPLGSQHAHHICANTICVNPDHLQPVTHRENVAEMMARQSYLRYIAELQEALREFAPDHPLLHRIEVA